jgi:DNA-binding transcriptional ArsR family regulator
VDGFSVLAEPTRRRILDELRFAKEPGDPQSGRDVATLVSVLGLPQPSVSKHLRVLRDAGVVAARVDGPRRVYRLSAHALGDVAAWLEPYRQMWVASLDALESHLDTLAAAEPKNDEE